MVLIMMRNDFAAGKTRFGIRFATVDVALVGVFSALWIVLNLALGPLSFQLLHLPIIHDFAVFFTLLLVVWLTQRFGTCLAVGIIGSVVAIFLGPSQIINAMICFAASAVLFDLLMSMSRHKVRTSLNFAVAALATVISASFAGALFAVLFSPGMTLQDALIFWGGWHAVGGVLSVVLTMPVIAALEKANVRKLVSSA